MRCVRNNKGFTLIEIIVVIVIISILSVISIFTFGKIRESSKNKADELAYNSIMKCAASYAIEYYNEEKYWLHIENEDIETFCVPVLELSNKGYLKQDDINNVSYNFVLLTRDYINKTIIREEYDKEGICGGSTDREKGNLQLISQSTTSISVSGGCESSGFVNYTYGLFDKNNNEIKNYTTKDDTYKFSNLNINTQYYIKLKCNYQDYNNTDYSDGIKVQTGYTDLEFIPKNIVKDTTKNRVYKEIDINYTSKNIYKKENAIYYFKVTSEENISTSNVFECGNDKTPSLSCSSNSTTELKKGYWYKTTSNNNKLNIYNNSTIYTKIWDGERFSTNKSIQVILPTNPYVIVNIKHKLYNGYNGSFVGEDNNIIDYNINNWMSMPDISWNIYSGYETESIVYYSNSGNDDDDYSNRRSADIDSGYKCNSNSCTFNKGNIGNNGGMQQIKIVVKNKTTNDKTIIYINVNIDKKAPTLDIINSSGGNWTKDDVKITLNYSDKYSGIDKSTIKRKDNKDNKDWQSISYDENIGDIWYDEGDRVRYYKVCDYADNCIEASTNIKIDRTAPKLTIDNPVGNNWTNKNITLNLKFSDGGSGINVSSLKWMDNASQTTWKSLNNTNTSTREETWDDEGNRIVTYEICDNVGNCTDASTIIKIDRTPPELTIDNLVGNNWTTKNITVNLKFSDSGSGINASSLKWMDNASQTTWRYIDNNDTSSYVAGWSTPGDRTGYYQICDNAGNCTERSTNIKIDKTPPTDPTTFTISNGNIVVSGSTDKESGFGHYFYSLWNSSLTTTLASGNSGSVSLSNITSAGTYRVYAGAMDKAGNASGSPGKTISVTDKSTSSWYSCDSGTRSGAYCYHYGTVRYATSCKTCSYYSSDCKCASVNRANCPIKCRKSYNKASSCTSAGYLWNSEGYCWSYYVYDSSCSDCGYTSSPYCDKGYTYSNGSCYYTTGATYHTSSSCSSGYTEYNGKCYKLS